MGIFMKYSRRKLSPVSLALALLACQAQAADQGYPTFDFNAYGTIGAAHSTEDKADFVSGPGQSEGAGDSEDVTFAIDSRVAAQLTVNFTPKLTAVAQVVSEQRDNNSWTPYFEWANIKYDFTPDMSVRVGRIVLPSFIVSDYRKIGYANHWARPPVEVYSMVPVTNSDGIDAIWRLNHGNLTNTLQPFAGRKNLHFGGATWEGKHVLGFTDTLEFGNALLRASYIRADVTSAGAINQFFDAFKQFGPLGSAIADRYQINGTRIEGIVAGARYDAGNWFTMAEWVRTSSHSFLGSDRGWYVTGGYHFGAFTPFATYSTRDALDNYEREQGLEPLYRALPPQVLPVAGFLNMQLQGLIRSTDSSTLSVGTRWDFRENFNFALQLDHVDLEDGTSGSLINVQPGFVSGGSLNIITATVSFVY